MKKYKYINIDLAFCFIIFLSIFFISIRFINGFISYDTYKMYDLGYKTYAKEVFFADGRIFSGIYISFANLINISLIDLYKISYILCILIITINIIYFKKMIITFFEEKKYNRFIVYLLSFLTIFNFSYIDIMRFIEMPILALSILFYIISAKEAVIKENSKKSIIYLIFATFMYQGTINVFFMMVIFLWLQKNSDRIIDKSQIIGIIRNILYCIIPVVLNFIFITIYGRYFHYTDRLNSENISIINNIEGCLRSVENLLINTHYIMPTYFYIIILILFILIIYIYFINLKLKKIGIIFFRCIMLLFFSVLTCMPTILLFNTPDIASNSLAVRLFWSFGAAFGFIMLQVYINKDLFEIKNKNLTQTIVIFSMIFYLVQYYSMYIAMKELVKCNEIDKSICSEIEKNILEYEKLSRNNIDKLEVFYNISGHGISQKNTSKINKSYICLCLPIKKYMQFYSGKQYEINYITDSTEKYNEDIKTRFEGNIAYIHLNI